MAKVLVLPGIERRDLCGPYVPAAEVLAAAIENGITDVVVVGRSRDGEQYIAGSLNDVDKVVGVLFAAATALAGVRYRQGMLDDEAPTKEPA